MDPWTHARASFQRHFAPLVDRGLELERLPDAPAYWSLHAATLSEHFPPEVFFDLPALRTGAERRGQAELARVSGEQPLRDFTVVRERGDVVAMFSGEQRGEGAYRMWHTHVRTDHRRRGIYRQLLESTIAYTRELGFDAITSEH
ncbi:MAG: GNAT family N-acetyltransferase [Polyangiaceae bacterium]|nr:GNAT family N-acetyltransferase [Polyangiaceae bacterium]